MLDVTVSGQARPSAETDVAPGMRRDAAAGPVPASGPLPHEARAAPAS